MSWMPGLGRLDPYVSMIRSANCQLATSANRDTLIVWAFTNARLGIAIGFGFAILYISSQWSDCFSAILSGQSDVMFNIRHNVYRDACCLIFVSFLTLSFRVSFITCLILFPLRKIPLDHHEKGRLGVRLAHVRREPCDCRIPSHLVAPLVVSQEVSRMMYL